jgi:hypothetical protein
LYPAAADDDGDDDDGDVSTVIYTDENQMVHMVTTAFWIVNSITV